MQIFELGIIVNSVSIFTSQYDKNSEFSRDPDLRNSVLDAILKMNSMIWSQDIQSFNFKKYKIIILLKTITPSKPTTSSTQVPTMQEALRNELSENTMNSNTSLVFYCIGETKLKVKFIKSILERIGSKFISQYPDIHEPNKYALDISKNYNPVFENIITNLKANQTRKLKNVI
jgi:hypothetical protein